MNSSEHFLTVTQTWVARAAVASSACQAMTIYPQAVDHGTVLTTLVHGSSTTPILYGAGPLSGPYREGFNTLFRLNLTVLG
jgi:hypothetical protein